MFNLFLFVFIPRPSFYSLFFVSTSMESHSLVFPFWLQQFQADDIVVKAGPKAEAKVVLGNKQRRINRRKAQNDTATQKDNVVSVCHSIDSSAQEGGLKRPSQLKARKHTATSLTAMLTTKSEVCVTLSYFSCLVLVQQIYTNQRVSMSTPNY